MDHHCFGHLNQSDCYESSFSCVSIKMINQRNKLFAIFTNRLSRLAFVLNSKRDLASESLDSKLWGGLSKLELRLTPRQLFHILVKWFYANSADQTLWKANQWRIFTEVFFRLISIGKKLSLVLAQDSWVVFFERTLRVLDLPSWKFQLARASSEKLWPLKTFYFQPSKESVSFNRIDSTLCLPLEQQTAKFDLWMPPDHHCWSLLYWSLVHSSRRPTHVFSFSPFFSLFSRPRRFFLLLLPLSLPLLFFILLVACVNHGPQSTCRVDAWSEKRKIWRSADTLGEKTHGCLTTALSAHDLEKRKSKMIFYANLAARTSGPAASPQTAKV